MSRSKAVPSSPKKATPVLSQYLSIKEAHADCLLFFQMGDFFELFFEDAKTAAEALGITLTKRGVYDDAPVPMCGVPLHASQNYIARLLKQGFKVALCEQKGGLDPSAKQPIERAVTRILTPGTLLEDCFLAADQNNFLLCLAPENATPNAAWAGAMLDISTGEFFVETLQGSLLDFPLLALNPREVLLPFECMGDPLLRPLTENAALKLSTWPRQQFHLKASIQHLQQFYGVQTLDIFGTFTDAQKVAAGTLLAYVSLTQKTAVKIAPPQNMRSEDFLAIDARSLKSLEVLTSTEGKLEGSLLHVIDKTLTPAGRRLLKKRLLFPLKDPEAINARLDAVACFVKNPSLVPKIQSVLKGMPDLERPLARLTAARATPKDLGQIREGLRAVPHLIGLLRALPLPQELLKVSEALKRDEALITALERALCDEPFSMLTPENFLKRGYHTAFDTQETAHQEALSELVRFEQNSMELLQIPSLKVRSNNLIGFYIEVGKKHTAKVPSTFILKQTLLQSVRYTTPELVALEGQIQAHRSENQKLRGEVFKELCTQVESQAKALLEMARALAVLDVTLSFAQGAIENHHTRPTFVTEKGFFEIRQGRHPVVEQALRAKEADFQANDCQFSVNEKLLLLTGPNMAGKSTFLRQNALIVLLAQVGAFVPAAQATLSVTDKIFSRIGASDNLAQNESTFMSEMIETAKILHQATDQSFVILDEVGRGTSFHEGQAIAHAVIDHLVHHIGCCTLFATHFYELTAIEQTTPEVVCYTFKVLLHNGDVLFLHELVLGKNPHTYALHTAKKAGLPAMVLAKAESYLKAVSPKEVQPDAPSIQNPQTKVS